MTDRKKTKWINFRLWHLFVIVAIAAWIAPTIPFMGNCRAYVVIKDMSVIHDQEWGKSWAVLECEYLQPKMLKGEKIRAFIDIDQDFVFGDKYSIGDRIDFRYQYRDYGEWTAQDPGLIILREVFGFDAEPNKHEDGLYIIRSDGSPESAE